jgi:Rps23 Pro-64 3,4-dihydroxylase Tpa1-like proline 4-hydroxylase
MKLRNFIKTYDNVLPLKTLTNLIRYANIVNFDEALIGGSAPGESVKNFDVRRTYNYGLLKNSNKFSDVHWCNLLQKTFNDLLISYHRDLNILDYNWRTVKDIQVLKYENTGFYKWHTDHFHDIPRTYTIVYLLNNDYDGGNLSFRNPDGSEEWEVKTEPNKVIIWPSNFLYPHTVKSVTKGIRYSIVAWAL